MEAPQHVTVRELWRDPDSMVAVWLAVENPPSDMPWVSIVTGDGDALDLLDTQVNSHQSLEIPEGAAQALGAALVELWNLRHTEAPEAVE